MAGGKIVSRLVTEKSPGYHMPMGRIWAWQEDQEAEIAEAVRDHLSAGEIVALPTDTFYALAADPFNATALKRLFHLKGRVAVKPVLVLVAGPGMLSQVCRELPDLARALIEGFWPGPLTLILPARPGLSLLVTGGTETIGVRQPRQPLVCRLLSRLGFPVTGTSANRAGGSPLCRADEVAREFSELPLILDAGACPGGAPSTIVDVSRDPPRLVRVGTIPAETLRKTIPRLVP